MTQKIKKQASTKFALLTLAGVLGIILGGNVFLGGSLHLMIFLSWLFIIPMCMTLGYTYEEINGAMMDYCKIGLGPVLLLMAVGAIISTWIAAGSVPTIIYFGLQIIRPNIFLVTSFLLCGLVSLSCGTSWGAAGTAGIAMFAIGESLGIPAGMTVGSIVSGSFLGDMLSPMSDSTNIAAATAKTELITHCKQLSFIVIPSVVISAIVYYFLGVNFASNSYDNAFVLSISQQMESLFKLDLVTMIPVLVLLVMLIKKIPAVPTLLTSSLVAGFIAVVYQGLAMKSILPFMWSGYKIATGVKFLDTLLNRGGVTSMFATAALMIYAFGMIGAFRVTGILDALILPVVKKANSVKKLTFVTQTVALITNVLGTSNFSLIITGSLMSPAYDKFKLHPTNLSKVLNSTSTVTAPLIPWNIAGIYIIGLFGVGAGEFIPYAFICYLTPIIAFIMAAVNYRVVPDSVKLENGEKYIKEKVSTVN